MCKYRLGALHCANYDLGTQNWAKSFFKTAKHIFLIKSPHFSG